MVLTRGKGWFPWPIHAIVDVDYCKLLVIALSGWVWPVLSTFLFCAVLLSSPCSMETV